MQYIEGSKFKPLNFPDPHGFGDKYKPVFPPRHRAVKAILDNLPDTIEKVYIFGSSIRTDCCPASDLDVMFIGSMTNDEFLKIAFAMPEGENMDYMFETAKDFLMKLDNEPVYRKIYEKGYKIYEKET